MKTLTDMITYFFIIWIIVLVANQVLFYNACFKIYCIKVALPHTAIISTLIIALVYSNKSKQNKED